MAGSTEQWLCNELTKLGIDVAEDSANYILSMNDAEDLHEYMLSFLDSSDPAVHVFLSSLKERWYAWNGISAPLGHTVHQKSEQSEEYMKPRNSKKKPENRKKRWDGNGSNPVQEMSSAPNNFASVSTNTQGMIVYRKSDQQQDYVKPKKGKKNGKGKNRETENGDSDAQGMSSMTNLSTSVSASMQSGGGSNGSIKTHIPSQVVNGMTSNQTDHQSLRGIGKMIGGELVGQGAKKKTTFVPLYGQQGKEKLIITLPGRTQCECQASKHDLINNCTSCGRVVCAQEGAGPCFFCGKLVCTEEDQKVISRGSKKSENVYQHLMRDADKFTPLCRGGGEREILSSVSSHMMEGLEKAQRHKDRLIEYDRTSSRRTQVLDDECDYFATDSNRWLSKEDREALRKREEELRAARFASRRDRKFTLDFAGRQVIEEVNTVGQTMYSHQDAVVQRVQYGSGNDADRKEKFDSENDGHLVNPHILQRAPLFVPDEARLATKPSRPTEKPLDRPRVPVIQDRELLEMTDQGMCLSMHQPWASLLVAGIKIHEGRTWNTAHRGRLWIAATAQPPSQEEISEMENQCQLQSEDRLTFPAEYPTGCLLGCVNVVDCLPQEDYREKFPDGESSSPYVFICEHPHELVIKFPIKGQHKIYKLDSAVHQAAKKGLIYT